MPYSPLSWRTGTRSEAGKALSILLQRIRLRPPGPSSPFLAAHHPSATWAPLSMSHGYLLHLSTHTLRVFSDNSAILANATQSQFLPRALQYHTRPPSAGRATVDGMALAHRAADLWEEHRQGPCLAHPLHTPAALGPPPGHFWCPYDAFPTPTVVEPRHTGPSDHHMLLPETAAAAEGFVRGLFPHLTVTKRLFFSMLRMDWDPDAPFVVRCGASPSQHRTLPPRAFKLLIAVLPEIKWLVGAGFWAAPPTNIHEPLNSPFLSVALDPATSAHALLAQKAAWTRRLSTEQHEEWAHILHHHTRNRTHR